MAHIDIVNNSLEIARSENGDSTSSELERLEDNYSPCPSGIDSPTERGIAKNKKSEDLILKLIHEANALGTNTLDLSHKGMRQFPSEILEMPQLEVNTRVLWSIGGILGRILVFHCCLGVATIFEFETIEIAAYK